LIKTINALKLLLRPGRKSFPMALEKAGFIGAQMWCFGKRS
jgi:hypothetical protein